MAFNMDDMTTYKLQKLQPGEYTKWARNMDFVLSGHGLYDYVTGDAPVVVNPDTGKTTDTGSTDDEALERKQKKYCEYKRGL